MILYAIYKNRSKKLGIEELKLPEIVKPTVVMTPEIHPVDSPPQINGHDQIKDEAKLHETVINIGKESSHHDDDNVKNMDASNQV